MFMKNVMVKTKILTQEIQSIKINILDTLEAAQATIATLKHMRNDSDALDKEIEAAVVFSEKFGIDVQAEFQKHHRPRRPPIRVDERAENTAMLNVNEFYRKEFIQILDTQLSSLTDNLRVPLEILLPLATLLQPPFNQNVDQSDCQLVINMLPVGLQSDASALEAEITVFRNHCYQNKSDITTTEKAAMYPVSSRVYFLLRRNVISCSIQYQLRLPLVSEAFQS
ncbi:Uncharacterised protein g2079 [Pycnogonum litorale]